MSNVFFSFFADIYAIGIVLWELVNRCIKGKYERPYSEFPHIAYEYQIILQAAKQGLRPTIPPCPEPMAKLIAECWVFVYFTVTFFSFLFLSGVAKVILTLNFVAGTRS
jgi:hypothetical protein